MLTGLLHIYFAGLRRRQEAWLQRSRLAAIVESSSDAIVGTSLSGVITDWNPAAEQLFGYKAEEAVGQQLLDVGVPRISCPKVKTLFDKCWTARSACG